MDKKARNFSPSLKAVRSIAVILSAGYILRHKTEHKVAGIRRKRNRKILLTSLPLALFAAGPLCRKIIQRKAGKVITKLTTNEYEHNVMEIWSAFKRADLQNVLENGLRATEGTAITRPLGSPKRFDGFDNLMFAPPQMAMLAKSGDTEIDMKVTLGPRAVKPLTVNIPLLISGMAYGLALSEPAKIALASGAKAAGTAINSGEGPYLKEESRAAGKYILQISSFPWGLRTDKEIAVADMLEVRISQGAQNGVFYVAPEEIKGKARRLMGLSRNQGLSSLPAPPGVQTPADWPVLVSSLRRRAKGVPIGLKMAATDKIEDDLALAVDAGFDVIAIDGAQGGALRANPTMQDDFGIPSLHALVRAVRYLEKRGVREHISLIAAGGYFNPGSCLKALALGADAIYLGTLPLYALVNKQHRKVIPWEPPTTLVSYASKYKKKLDSNLSAERVANILRAMTVEMEQALRALGKTSINDLGPADLVALDTFSAELTGVKRAY